MKFILAPLLLSSVFVLASADSKAAKLAKAKFPKAKAKVAKSGYGSMCMSTLSMSMSVGPEPPITPSPTPGAPTTPPPTLTPTPPPQPVGTPSPTPGAPTTPPPTRTPTPPPQPVGTPSPTPGAPTTPPPTRTPTPQPTPEPSLASTPEPITLTACGEPIINTKVVLTDNLDCGGPRDDDVARQECAVTLDGPEAEINCNDNTLSQVASSPLYGDGPFERGICLNNGAKARNCIVQQFRSGIYVTDGGEVVNSNLSSNYRGIYAEYYVASTLTIENVDSSNNSNHGLYTLISDDVNAKLNVKGKVTFDSNEQDGINTSIYPNANLDIVVETGALLNTASNKEIGLRVSFADSGAESEFNVDVKEGGFFESCGNVDLDIFGNPKMAFLGDGSYTCGPKLFYGTVVEPVWQDCPSN